MYLINRFKSYVILAVFAYALFIAIQIIAEIGSYIK